MRRDGFIRVAASTPEVKVADVEFNREQVCKGILEEEIGEPESWCSRSWF